MKKWALIIIGVICSLVSCKSSNKKSKVLDSGGGLTIESLESKMRMKFVNINHDFKHRPRFHISETEVTLKQWRRVMDGWDPEDLPEHEKDGCVPIATNDNDPVTCITQKEAEEFTSRLTESASRQVRAQGYQSYIYDLLTLEDWDLATNYKEYEGTEFGNCGANSKITEVKTKKPNKFGLYDVVGNVSEWTTSDRDRKKPAIGHAFVVGSSAGSAECSSQTMREMSIKERSPNVGFRVIRYITNNGPI